MAALLVVAALLSAPAHERPVASLVANATAEPAAVNYTAEPAIFLADKQNAEAASIAADRKVTGLEKLRDEAWRSAYAHCSPACILLCRDLLSLSRKIHTAQDPAACVARRRGSLALASNPPIRSASVLGLLSAERDRFAKIEADIKVRSPPCVSQRGRVHWVRVRVRPALRR